MSDTSKRVKPSAASITPIRESGKAVVLDTPQEIKSNRLLDHMHSGADIEKIPPTKWQLKGKIVQGGLTALYSEPGLGKSFVAIDMCMAAVLNESWWGEHFPEDSKVLYIAAERYSEVADRVRAAAKKRNVSMKQLENFTLLASPTPPQITQSDRLELHADFLDLVEIAAKMKPDVIVFDTFARMTLGEDENSTKDMGVIVENFLRIVRAAGEQCSGFVVHHAGKDRSRGLRGSTALLGALDAVLKLEKKGEALVLSVEKINAAETPQPAYFVIESIDMPDPQEAGAMRSVGVLVSKDYAQVASGIEGDLLALMCEIYPEGASLAKIRAGFNAEHKPPGKDAQGYSEPKIRRAMRVLEDKKKSVVRSGEASKTIYMPTAKALAAYREQHPAG